MELSEKELEDVIYHTNDEKIQSKGLFYKGVKFRQLKIGNYGIADIVTAYRSYYHNKSILTITVYELKKGILNTSAFLQALRYCMGIKRYINERKPNILFKLRIILVGDSIDLNSDFVYLTTLFDNESTYIANGKISSVNLYTYSFDIDGFSFERKIGYDLNSPGYGFKIDDDNLPF